MKTINILVFIILIPFGLFSQVQEIIEKPKSGQTTYIVDQNSTVTSLKAFDVVLLKPDTSFEAKQYSPTLHNLPSKIASVCYTHTKDNNTDIVTVYAFTCDHQFGLLEHKQEFWGHTELIVANTYNDINQLAENKVGNTDSNILSDNEYKTAIQN